MVTFECILQVPWFTHRVVHLASGPTQIPEGQFCWDDGTACEVWPLETKASIVKRYFGPDKKFKKEFDLVREAVKKTSVAIKQQQVCGTLQGPCSQPKLGAFPKAQRDPGVN